MSSRLVYIIVCLQNAKTLLVLHDLLCIYIGPNSGFSPRLRPCSIFHSKTTLRPLSNNGYQDLCPICSPCSLDKHCYCIWFPTVLPTIKPSRSRKPMRTVLYATDTHCENISLLGCNCSTTIGPLASAMPDTPSNRGYHAV